MRKKRLNSDAYAEHVRRNELWDCDVDGCDLLKCLSHC